MALLAFVSPQQMKAVCGTYDPSTNICGETKTGMDGSMPYSYFYVYKCPSGKYCDGADPKNSGSKGYCKDLAANSASCNSDEQCASRYCNGNNVCGDRSAIVVGDKCKKPGKPLTETLYCNNGNTVAEAKAIGSDCVPSDGHAQCKQSMCNKATNKCDTFKNTLMAQGFPTLQGADSNGWKPCTMATANTDCVYKKDGATVDLPGFAALFKCFPPMMSENGQSYCALGGAESVLLRAATIVFLFR